MTPSRSPDGLTTIPLPRLGGEERGSAFELREIQREILGSSSSPPLEERAREKGPSARPLLSSMALEEKGEGRPLGIPKKSRSTHCPLAAFTLIEMLLVIAVIAVLAALLLPALVRGKAAAQRATCLSNLHQFGIAAQMYWDDYGGNSFRYSGAVTNGGQIYWFGWIGPGAEGQRPFDAALGALYPYLRGRGVEICPALNYALPEFKLKAAGAAYGYGYNLTLSPAPSRPPFNMHKLGRPSELALLADAAQINTFQPPASPTNPMLEEWYYVSNDTNQPNTHFRHAQRADVVFCDMHVASERYMPDSIDQRLPHQFVGRLRPEILVLP
jgi:prepilin-type N-terminal cleavage/methylation domain-containing protein